MHYYKGLSLADYRARLTNTMITQFLRTFWSRWKTVICCHSVRLICSTVLLILIEVDRRRINTIQEDLGRSGSQNGDYNDAIGQMASDRKYRKVIQDDGSGVDDHLSEGSRGIMGIIVLHHSMNDIRYVCTISDDGASP